MSALGLVAASSGLVMLSAPSAQADHKESHGQTNQQPGNQQPENEQPGNEQPRVGVCHREKATQTYEYVVVSASATGEPHGHTEHLADGNAADPSYPDYVLTSPGVPGGVDTESEFAAWCVGVQLPQLSLTYITRCDVGGEIARPTDTDLVTYSIEGGAWSGLEGDVTVTATLTDMARAFTGSTGAWTVTGSTATRTISFGSADEPCGSTGGGNPIEVEPDVDVTQPSCTGPGTWSPLTVTWENGVPEGVSYARVDSSVTATAGAGYVFSETLPEGWVGVSDTIATYRISVVDPGDCLVPVAAQEPYATDATCTTPGHLVLPSSPEDGYHWDGDTRDEPGDHTVLAVADPGYELTAPMQRTVHVPVAGEGATGCGGQGGPTDPVDPTPSNPGSPGGNPGGPGTTAVVPLEPIWTEATCTTPADVAYRSVAGVTYRTVGDVAPGNRVVVESEVLQGYSFADGTVTWWAYTFEALQGCDGGAGNPGGGDDDDEEPTEGVVPSPTVKGVQKFRPPTGKGDGVQPGTGGPHAVPTAVAAGLADLPGGHGSPSTFSSPQLAQALVAGGLLLLVVGGGLGLGRRANGAHEF